MKKCIVSIGFILFTGLTMPCTAQNKNLRSTSLTPAQYTDLSRAVISFMECDDCEDGETDTLLKWGQKCVPALIAILEKGPSPARIYSYKQFLSGAYKEMAEYAVTHPGTKLEIDENKYVEKFIKNYIAQYRLKAAYGLGLIRGYKAKQALAEAQSKTNDKELLNGIKKALKNF